jgi:HEAT repeat protein
MSEGTETNVVREWFRLRQLRRAGDIEALLRELDNPRAEESGHGAPFTIREGALKELDALGDWRAVNPVAKLLQDPLPSVRSIAARVLGRLGDESVGPELEKAMGDPSDEVRWNVARGLGDVRFASAVPTLIAALNDECRWVRVAAAQSLGKLGDPRALTPLREARRRQGLLRLRRRGTYDRAILRIRLADLRRSPR